MIFKKVKKKKLLMEKRLKYNLNFARRIIYIPKYFF